MNLYRIDIEWKEYIGAGEYETKKLYLYVAGNRQLGKQTYDLIKDDYQIVNIQKLKFSLKGFWICFRTTLSYYQNEVPIQKKK